MSDPLYTKDVLRLAAEARGAGRLPSPHGSFTEANPACGDRATVDICVSDGRIDAVALETKACVLAQASASILGATLKGRTRDDLTWLRTAIVAMFQNGQAPAEPFARYGLLTPAAVYPSRHRCVLLPLDAAIKAFDASQAREPGGERTEG